MSKDQSANLEIGGRIEDIDEARAMAEAGDQLETYAVRIKSTDHYRAEIVRDQANEKETMAQALHRHPQTNTEGEPVTVDQAFEMFGELERLRSAARQCERLLTRLESGDRQDGGDGHEPWNAVWEFQDRRYLLVRDFLAAMVEIAVTDHVRHLKELNNLYVYWKKYERGVPFDELLMFRQGLSEVKFIADDRIKEIEKSYGPAFTYFQELIRSNNQQSKNS